LRQRTRYLKSALRQLALAKTLRANTITQFITSEGREIYNTVFPKVKRLLRTHEEETMFRKLILFVGLLVAVTAVLSACGGGGGNAGAGAATVSVEGSEFAYTPADITAKPGQKVTVNFKNVGTVEHTFVIKDLNFKLTAQPGQSASGTFTAPSTPGTFQIHCDVAGHTEAGMVGKLTVQ